MDITALLEKDFTPSVKAFLAQKAVVSDLSVPDGHLTSAFEFYSAKGDYFIAADVAQVMGDNEKRARVLNHAASKLVQTRKQDDLDFKKEFEERKANGTLDEKKHYRRFDYHPIQEGSGFLGGGALINVHTGKVTDFGKIARETKAEQGPSFERLHVEAIRSVLRGDLDEAKEGYNKLLSRASRATVGSSNIIPTGTMKPMEEAVLALEIGYFDHAFEIFDRHGMNNYGGILARHLGDEEKALRLFDQQIESSRNEGNYAFAANVAEMKGDLGLMVDILHKGNDRHQLIKAAEKYPNVDGKVKVAVRDIRDKLVRRASGLSLRSAGIKEAVALWDKYDLSPFQLFRNAYWSKYGASNESELGYVSDDSDTWFNEARSIVNGAEYLSRWLGEQDKADSLREISFQMAVKENKLGAMADYAIEINDEVLMKEILGKIDPNNDPNNKRVELLRKLGRFDEALEVGSKYLRGIILKEASRWEELCDFVEQNRRSHIEGGPLEAYQIATEHGLTERADKLYAQLCNERGEIKDRYVFYDMVPQIIARGDMERARTIVEKAKEELFSAEEIDDYEQGRLEDMAKLAEYAGDGEAADLFATVSKLSKAKDLVNMSEYDLEDRSTYEEMKLEIMVPIRRYEKYVKPLENCT